MTNIQAIDLLKGLEQSLDDYCELNDEGKTAFHMAITALEVFGNSEQLPSAQPEIIHCCECKWLQCNMRPDGYLPKGVDEFECRHWCGYCDPMDYCSYAVRRADELGNS